MQVGVHEVVLQQHRQEGAQPLPRQRLALRGAQTLALTRAAHTATTSTAAAAAAAAAAALPPSRAE